ncbi:hypothetical protein CPK_ORF00785 [Chlamydia pneumoniae LPCoLN]|uniref:Uncharacterized protein n=1 Tax=Chlamydia pneumoniae TaxID=83558 RepID=Q9K263_CHLPN|nr:hypothetical protein CP_0482 [Chlamydia pneumoniae AR39]ACZ33252.1 hypothetical protein CPK_ORF00785 [Chlamydia pneumoniae LPCoLN]CRI32777.1 Uncharacterized protein BN1224_Wien1_A_02840 [Chlamydia pneumoniae]CRI36767.1 Uncharacterized protein BN1224_CV14_A_02860 [Chlamydia pneumoniae]CRI37890.1 Uncharacterized protein BN1224_CV15_B_02130 [Chlamydia pneumoniae]
MFTALLTSLQPLKGIFIIRIPLRLIDFFRFCGYKKFLLMQHVIKTLFKN